MTFAQGARVLTQDFEGGVGDDVAAATSANEEITAGGGGGGGGEGDVDADAAATSTGEVSADPTEFGAMPSYAAGDTWGARFSDAQQHVKKAFNAATKKANSHAAPRIKAHHGYLHKASHGYIKDFVPKEYSPFIAAVVSYTLPILPFCLAIAIFRQMKAMLSLQKFLMALNCYNAFYCALLVVINIATGNEPMASLQASNEADYIILQFLKCIGYLLFVLIQMVHVGVLWTTKAENMKVVATGNLMLSICIGFHYFIKVWSPAMHGHPPSTSQVSYALYTTMFAAMAYSNYVKADPGERAQAGSVVSAVFGGDSDKQY